MTNQPPTTSRAASGKKIAVISVLVSGSLSVLNVVLGLWARSTSVTAAGVEFAADVGASFIVLTGMTIAARPADEDHPYGHGRFEMLAGLVVGFVLFGAGAIICYRSLDSIGEAHPPPRMFAIWPLVISMAVKAALALVKFRTGQRIQSGALLADAWNDTVDIFSAAAALVAVVLTLYDPTRFIAADHYGGFAVGVIVVLTGLRVIRDTSLELTDIMPPAALTDAIRSTAGMVPGVHAIEKCFARKTGLQYHVDLHIEVDPDMTVFESHQLATEVRYAIRRELASVADVLVHVEPLRDGARTGAD